MSVQDPVAFFDAHHQNIGIHVNSLQQSLDLSPSLILIVSAKLGAPILKIFNVRAKSRTLSIRWLSAQIMNYL
jgi:hypothetical protein